MLRALPFLVLALAAAGCGEREREGSGTSPQPSAATATPDPAGADAAAATAVVTIKGFTYDPARVTVRSGGEVTWTNEDASNHTVTFAQERPDDVGNLREGRSATVTFAKRGAYAYVCDFHPGMAGTVEVR